MKKYLPFIAMALITLTLSGCAGRQRTILYEGNIKLTASPPHPIDPPDRLVAAAVTEFLENAKAPISSDYDFHRFDLNNDGRREALVLFKSPYGYWCDVNGCAMLVFKAQDKGFTLVNTVQPVREPLFISDSETNGWKDLIIHVSGRPEKTKDVALQFNGEHYPDNPSSLPEYLRYASNNEMRLFHD